jgi:hypothetical protein
VAGGGGGERGLVNEFTFLFKCVCILKGFASTTTYKQNTAYKNQASKYIHSRIFGVLGTDFYVLLGLDSRSFETKYAKFCFCGVMRRDLVIGKSFLLYTPFLKNFPFLRSLLLLVWRLLLLV